MKARLVSDSPLTPELQVVLDKLPVVVGRGSEVDVRLEDRWVSRIHCRIEEIDRTLVVRDLQSRNGTLVNGRYIQEARLLPGDRLAIGLNRFQVQYKWKAAGSRAATRD